MVLLSLPNYWVMKSEKAWSEACLPIRAVSDLAVLRMQGVVLYMHELSIRFSAGEDRGASDEASLECTRRWMTLLLTLRYRMLDKEIPVDN
ncbi:hypothetical protein CEXT_491841 [Caerostris extrusa]|uniref:Uncharacterized protein n=1 Tax=Caerostris extrusa TaxID=172846 RepID=A0AAV4USY1_CAEEX|nr:hypothetical protein CEXT_491841 [Caerostris extrusa]